MFESGGHCAEELGDVGVEARFDAYSWGRRCHYRGSGRLVVEFWDERLVNREEEFVLDSVI